jgi:hypothetical protein
LPWSVVALKELAGENHEWAKGNEIFKNSFLAMENYSKKLRSLFFILLNETNADKITFR